MNPHILTPLWRRFLAGEDGPIFHWRDLRGRPAGTLGLRDLVRAFSAIADDLRARGLRPGDRVLLVYPPSLDFIVAFGGCLWAGVIPVPTYPPVPGVEADERRLALLAETSGCRLALTNRRFRWLRRLDALARLVRRRSAAPLEWWVTEARPQALEPHGPVTVALDDDAFLQFTSGSTSNPKGVRITHRNLAHQLADNRARLRLGPDTRAVLWVPQYHDLGLISGILSGLVGNGMGWFMSPLAFLRDPGLWFDLLTEVRGTHTAAPNFAFELLLKRTTPERRARWDVSTLRVVMSAAEPIRPETVGRFLEATAPAGFDPAAFCAAYGLAEHTVGVTIWGERTLTVDAEALERDRTAVIDPTGRAIPGCGTPSPDVRVRIVDPERGEALPPGRVGEIWVDSPSKAAGYWGQPELSARTFEATLPGESGAWLRTGDLGFLLDGELFVTGRLKDLIIIDGRNIAPEDLEDAARVVPGVRPGGIAAFAVDDVAAVVVEVREPEAPPAELQALARAVMQAIHGTWPVPVRLALVPPKTVSKTTSGKVRRRATREALLGARLPVLIESTEPQRACA